MLYHVALNDNFIREHSAFIQAVCRMNGIPFDPTGQHIDRDGSVTFMSSLNNLQRFSFGAGLTADGLRTLPTWRAMSCGRSTRILENHDIHRWITLRWPDPPLVLDGPMDGEAFLAYVEQLLAPALRPGGRLYRTHSDDNRVRSPPAVIKASLSECFHGPLSGQVVHDNGASMSRSPLFRSEGMPIPL